MIVICANCHAKFRVADEKIGPRGAKVRCSRCREVFHVGAGAAPPPLPAAREQAPPRPASVDLESPFGAPGSHAEEGSDADPFASAGLGLALSPPPPSPSDPFAAPAPAPDDPFARAAAQDAAAAPDPFAASPRDERAPAATDGGPLAVTDLSQLLGGAPVPEAAPAGPSGAGPSEPSGGLALEDRLTPPPLPAARAPLDAGGGLAPVLSADEFILGEPNTFNAYGIGPGDDEPLALATEPAARAAPHPPAAASAAAFVPVLAASEPEPLAALAEPAPAPVRSSEPRMATLADAHPPAPRESRLRPVLANAAALLGLLVATVVLLVVWRSEGPFDVSMLRPSAVLAALARGGASGPFSAEELRSGVYERENGSSLLFVRGKVVSHGPAAVPRVKVLVEIVRAGGVVARGETIAGAVLTPEELYRSGDAPGLAALEKAAAARAPAQIRPGEAVPFRVAIADPPAELEGASLRVRLDAAGGRRP